MNDLPAILEVVRKHPADEAGWKSLARWLRDNGRDDEAAAVRVFWPAIADSLAGMTIEKAMTRLERNARNLGRKAREFEEATVNDQRLDDNF